MRHVVAIHVHPHLRPLLGGSPPGLESVHFSKAATVEKSIFRDPGSHAEIKGRGGESAMVQHIMNVKADLGHDQSALKPELSGRLAPTIMNMNDLCCVALLATGT